MIAFNRVDSIHFTSPWVWRVFVGLERNDILHRMYLSTSSWTSTSSCPASDAQYNQSPTWSSGWFISRASASRNTKTERYLHPNTKFPCHHHCHIASTYGFVSLKMMMAWGFRFGGKHLSPKGVDTVAFQSGDDDSMTLSYDFIQAWHLIYVRGVAGIKSIQ